MAGLTLTFLGGAGTVTGSKHLLRNGDRALLVDCGLFQGVKELRQMNWQPLGFDARKIDAVVITHAHLDHTGYLPLLVKQGYSGPIYCSAPTADLARLVLLDSGKIQEEDAAHRNRHGFSKHKPALPLYTVQDVERVFPLFKTLELDSWHTVVPGAFDVRLRYNGHILGSTFVEVKAGGRQIAFSGDLGRAEPLTLKPPTHLEEADALVVESTYGDRCHSKEHPSEALARLINETLVRKGQVLIPTFAIGRTQDTLHLIERLKASGRVPDVPVYLDSPMGEGATRIFDAYPQWHRLSSPDLKNLAATCKCLATPEQSKAVTQAGETAIIVASSGMLTGGRILHHLVKRLPEERNTLIMVGYQGAGTLGRLLLNGADEAKIFGEYVPVRARVAEISALSAHADQREIVDWVQAFRRKPSRVFLVHGEPSASEGLRVRLADRCGMAAQVAKLGETVVLG